MRRLRIRSTDITVTVTTLVRIAVGALGVVMVVVGAQHLWDLGLDNGVAAVKWLAGGVVLHDFVLSPVLLVAGYLLVRRCPERVRGPFIVGAVVLGTSSVVAFPMLGRFGARPDNPSLLDRNYTVGWLVLAFVVAVGVLVGALGPQRHRSPSGSTGDPEPHSPLESDASMPEARS